MSDQKAKQTVGYFGAAWQEIVNRWLHGMLHYLEGREEFRLRDFRYGQDFSVDDTSPPPPWTGQASGMILSFGIVGNETEEMSRWIHRGGVPAVSLVNEWYHPTIPVVSTDCSAVIRMAADYYLEQGYRHFAYVGDTVNPLDSENCSTIFRRRLSERGFEAITSDLTFRPGATTEDLARADEQKDVSRMLRDAPKPLGVFAISDDHARLVCRLCEDLGLDVPGEVAVLGSGNLTTSRCNSPTISSVQTAAETIGYEAMKVLHQMMDGGKPPQRAILFPPLQVVERQSTRATANEGNDLRHALDFIEAHTCEGINVDDVVRSLSIARRTLEEHFVQRLGRSPGKEIQRVRLEKAKELLVGTELTITQIAMMTGFTEQPRLSEFFRKHTGMSPTEYREREPKRHKTGGKTRKKNT